jgi:hypothetical protein
VDKWSHEVSEWVSECVSYCDCDWMRK